MRKLLFLFLVITLIGINHVNSRRSGLKNERIEEEEDFSEFDSMLDEEESIPLKRDNKKANNFEEFDLNKGRSDIDDEDFEEDSEDLNDFNINSEDKPEQDKSAEKIHLSSNEKRPRGSSFKNLNVDELDMEEFEHLIGK